MTQTDMMSFVGLIGLLVSPIYAILIAKSKRIAYTEKCVVKTLNGAL